MIFNKIGADKHKYKAYIRFHKINNSATEKGLKFKVKIIRYKLSRSEVHIQYRHYH